MEQALLQGATAHGFEGELWTLDRIAKVIWRLSAVRHHPAHVWALRYRLGWTVQRPQRRAAEHDQAAIDHWVKTDWPRIKKRPTTRCGHLLFRRVRPEPDPCVRSTWAPRGRPPLLVHPFNWKKASMAAALCYGPAGGGCQLCFHLQPGNYDTDTLIVVLGELRRFLGGQKATLLWDGLPAHRSNKMKSWIAGQRRWLVERLPAYAPELNPVGGLWPNLKGKGGELANLCYPNLAGVITQAHRGVERVRQTPHLAYSFLRRSGLSVWGAWWQLAAQNPTCRSAAVLQQGQDAASRCPPGGCRRTAYPACLPS